MRPALLDALDLSRPATARRVLDRRCADREPVHDMTAVRAWARSRGYPIDECSGVPLAVLRTYRQVHAG